MALTKFQSNVILDVFNDSFLQKKGFTSSELNYNSDWSNLMMVVEKIAKIKGWKLSTILNHFAEEYFYYDGVEQLFEIVAEFITDNNLAKK